MAYSALDNLEPAYDAAKSLLLPFELRRWFVLAVVVYFVSGVTGFDINANAGVVDVPVTSPAPGGGAGTGGGFGPAGLTADFGIVGLLVIAAAVLLVGLLFALVGAIMEFVFVRIAERRDVRIRGYFGENTANGGALFVFRLFLGLIAFAVVLFIVALVIGTGVAGILIVFLLSPFLFLGFVGIYLLNRFTVDFVVPIMLSANAGILDGWQLLAAEIRAQTGEYAAYALVRIGLGIAASAVVGVGLVLVGVVIGIPFAIVAALVVAAESLVGLGGALTPLLVGTFAVYAIIVLIVGTVFVQVPVSTYLRYYSLLVLADLSPEFDLVDSVRRDIAAVEPPGGEPEPGDGS